MRSRRGPEGDRPTAMGNRAAAHLNEHVVDTMGFVGPQKGEGFVVNHQKEKNTREKKIHKEKVGEVQKKPGSLNRRTFDRGDNVMLAIKTWEVHE